MWVRTIMAITSSAWQLFIDGIDSHHIPITVIKILSLITYLFEAHTKIIKFY